MADENDVIESGASTGVDETSTPDDRSGDIDSSGDGGQGTPKENRIPYSRVKEMMAKERERAINEFREKEFAPLQKKHEEMNQRMIDAELARLKSMGWIKEEEPQPITKQELDKILSERDHKNEERRLQEYHARAVRTGWDQAQEKYPMLAKMSSFMRACVAQYAENPDLGFMKHADAVAADFEKYFADKAATASEERQSQMRPDRRVVPSGRGTGGTSSKEKQPKTVAERIREKLQERNKAG